MGLPGGARRSGEVEGVDEEGAEAAVRRLFFAGEDVVAASSGGVVLLHKSPRDNITKMHKLNTKVRE